MQMNRMVLVVVVAVSAAVVWSMPTEAPAASTAPLEEAFANRTVVEDIVECFINSTVCDAEQDKIRERAMAAMQNMGRCPESLCTEQQQLEMTRAMELLQAKHRDLWIKLLIAMFDLDLPQDGR